MTPEKVNEYLTKFNSDSTKGLYEYEINRFLSITNKPLSKITETDIYNYIETIRNKSTGEKTATSTVARKLSIVRNFLQFLYKRKHIKTDLAAEIELPKVNQKQPDILTEPEATALLRTPDKRTVVGLRDYLMLKIFLLTGCRLSELIQINWGDFDRKYNCLTLTLHGKGNKDRLVKIPKDLEAEIARYRNNQDYAKDEPLFLTTEVRNLKPQRISKIAIRNMLSKYCKKALIHKNITPHSLRHTCFSLEVANGADIFKVQAQAGHTSIAVTQRYIRLFDQLENNGVDYNPLQQKTKEVFA